MRKGAQVRDSDKEETADVFLWPDGYHVHCGDDVGVREVMETKVGLGGTFNVIHKGHELLFETAFTVGDSVEVGLTSDEFAKSIKSVPVARYFQRKANLAKYLERFGKPFDIVMISDMKGTAATSERLDALVVSPETRDNANEINDLRRRNGLKPLKVFTIKDVKADDTRLISSS